MAVLTSMPVRTAVAGAAMLTALGTSGLARADDAPPAATGDGGVQVTLHIAAAGAYRSVYDVSLLGAGGAASLDVEGRGFVVRLGGRALAMEVLGGLKATEIGGNVTAEARPLGDHLLVGAGFGVVNLQIARVKSPSNLSSTGPSVLGRLGYDFGRFLPYVALDLEVQWQADGATPWGPTLQVGVKL